MSKLVRGAAALGLFAWASCIGAETPQFTFSNGGEHRGVLEVNGLRFVVVPDPTTDLVEVDVRYDVGAREDPQGRSGLAHLVEHLMFQTRPDGPTSAPLFQSIIPLTTFFNAFTNWDQTHYMLEGRKENLDALLRVEFLRMYYAADLPAQNGFPAFGCSTVPAVEFEREREVVRNEIRAQSSADDYVERVVEAAIYPQGHAYQRDIGGDDRQIASAQLAEACKFMKDYYAPSRATVVIAGNVDLDAATKLVQQYFGKIPKRDAVSRTKVEPFTAPHGKVEIEADVERPSVWIGWSLPAGNTPEGEMARFGISSAFSRVASAAEKYDFAYSVQPAQIGGTLAPLFLMRIELKGMNKLDDALDFAQKAAKQAYRGFDEGSYEDLQEEKARESASFVERLETLTGRTLTLAQLIQFSKDVDFNSHDQYLFKELDKIKAFDNEKVGAVVKNTIDWEKAAIVVVKPNSKGLKGDVRSKVKTSGQSDAAMTDPQVDPAEAHRPIPISNQNEILSKANRFTLGNGMHVVLLQDDAMPLAAATLLFNNAGNASTPNSPALAALAAEALHLPMDAEAFARSGISIRCGSGADSMSCSTHGINIYLDLMLKGLDRQIQAGEYEQKAIESWQKHTAEDWKLKTEQEQNEFSRQIRTAVYGPDSPYTRTAIITPDAANKVHRDSLDNFRKEHYSAANATLVIVGKFDPKYAEKLARDTFGGWTKGTLDKPVDKTPFKRTGPTYIGVIQAKETQQVTAMLAYPAPAGLDGQEAARMVLTEMLDIRGGNVRFKLGTTYGLGFHRETHAGPGAYMMHGNAPVGGTIDAERTGESLKSLRDDLDALRKGDHFDEDFVRARRKILNNLLSESTVTASLASELAGMAKYNLPPTYYKTLIQQVAAVSTAQVKLLLEQELDPKNEVVVLMGDKAHLDKAFAGAGITDVKLIEPEYK